MAFLTEPKPPRGKAHHVADGVLRLVARNPGQMTCHGTNTYLIEDGDGFVVLDPGPAADQQHVDDIMAATGGRIGAILLSHGHHDHAGALAGLRKRSGALAYSFHASMAVDFQQDVSLQHGDRVGTLVALHTPGHAPDHMCFARDDGLVFTADHIMGWSSSVVSPPHGNMQDYISSLQFMIDRDDRVYLPGHGPVLPKPRAYVEELLRRRIAREVDILGALLNHGPMSVPQLSFALYAKADPVLQNAAERNVMSHLCKLWAEGKVEEDDEAWIAVR